MGYLGLDPIKNIASDYVKKNIIGVEKEVFDGYKRSKFPIAWKRNYFNKEKDMVNPLFKNISEAFRILFIAQNRTGKSFFMRAIADRLKMCGFNVVYLTDVKNEFHTSEDLVQKKFRDKLIDKEEPQGFDVGVYRPTFFQALEGRASRLPEGQNWCSLNLNELRPRDFVTLLRFLGTTSQQESTLQRAIHDAKKEGVEITRWEEFEDYLSQKEYVGRFGALMDKLWRIKLYNPFDSRYHMSPVKPLKEGKTLVLNLSYHDDLEEDNGFMQVTVTSWLRRIISARKEKEIGPVVFFIDETPRFVPRKGDTSSRHKILESIEVDAAHDVNYCFASQNTHAIPNRLIDECKHLFIPWNANNEFAKKIFKRAHLRAAKVQANQADRIGKVLRPMKKHDWLLIDTSEKSRTYITSLAPLSRVKETE